MQETLSFALDDCIPGRVAGVDEAGRGPLAGDVVAAAVILDPFVPIPGLNDSKKLTEKKRENLYPLIMSHAVACAIGRASVQEIDDLNILRASMLAMHRAVKSLLTVPDLVYVDGNRCPDWEYRSQAVIGGDGKLQAIAAASILAKVTRDRELVALDRHYPGYGFALHKGYPTRSHLQALEKLGPCPVHRRSYGPVAALLASQTERSSDNGSGSHNEGVIARSFSVNSESE